VEHGEPTATGRRKVTVAEAKGLEPGKKWDRTAPEGDDLTRPVPAMLTPSLPTWRRR
jgi:hypothetical protein